jgi:MFS transporter, DHA1 family, tetracycline resistance protein
VGVLAAIVQGGLIGKIKQAVGERKMLLIGSLMGALGFLLYGWAPSGYLFWSVMPIMAFWGLAVPAAQAIMTKHIAPNEQGRLQGAVGSLNSLAGIMGPTLFTSVFASVAVIQPQPWFAGATFWIAAALVALGGLIAWLATRKDPAAS